MQPVNEPPKVGGRGPDRRQRDPFVSRKIVRFLNEHPNTEFSSEAIAKSTNLTFRQVGQAMSRVVRQGDAVRGDIRGFWKAAVPQTAMSAARNSDSPQVPAGVAEGDVMEVFRVREGGKEIVLVDGDRNLYEARLIELFRS
jgi:hypothetical protein